MPQPYLLFLGAWAESKPGSGLPVYRKYVNKGLVVVDASALALPLVGGRMVENTREYADQIKDLAQRLTNLGPAGQIMVIAERAIAVGGPLAITQGDISSYLEAGYCQIYGALGLLAPPELTGTQTLLSQESLGHAVSRYLLAQAAAQAPARPTGTVYLVEVDGVLNSAQWLELRQTLKGSDLCVVATHARNGIVPDGMSAQRATSQQQVQEIMSQYVAE